jgi:hypothetical protein
MSKKFIPSWIYCPKCGSRLTLEEITNPQEKEYLKKQGYEVAARGVCECGVVAILCYQPLPASPTFSLFFDIYPQEAVRKIFISKQQSS